MSSASHASFIAVGGKIALTALARASAARAALGVELARASAELEPLVQATVLMSVEAGLVARQELLEEWAQLVQLARQDLPRSAIRSQIDLMRSCRQRSLRSQRSLIELAVASSDSRKRH